ncbi:MAG: alkaline phosphatase family protein [Verrucomicrobia bacterium]|nr:alkaline phosphatase family protein [Verrucomicrobiota bacterium]
MQRLALINVVGLTPHCLEQHAPRLAAFARKGRLHSIRAAFPAVTCTAQANYLTGKRPSEHGIVANGWYDRDLAEVHFWKQSNHLVQAPKVWEIGRGRAAGMTCAKLFWWYNMFSSADWSITPRPMYPADGRKVFDVYAWPEALRSSVKAQLGEFPFPCFWGPSAGVDSPAGRADAVSRWIAASAKWVEEEHQPTLSLIYLPHLDYNFQRWGPRDARVARDIAEIDAMAGDLIDFFEERQVQPLVVSEYGITAVDHPVHLNRVLREKGWLVVKEELGLELLNTGASRAFAVADHQVAHVYCNDPRVKDDVARVLRSVPGVDQLLEGDAKRAWGVDHARAGDLIAIAAPNAWFTYYYWMEDRVAPDFARCVDIHRKPGYDPVELFLDPKIPAVKARIAWRLLQKKLGFRMLMDVIPLDAGLVGGSHGRPVDDPIDGPVLIVPDRKEERETLESTDIAGILLKRMDL